MSAYRTETHVKLAYDVEPEDFARSIRAQRRLRVLARLVPACALVAVAVCAPMFLRLPLGAGLLASGLVVAFIALLVASAFRVRLPHLDRAWDDRRAQRIDVSEAAFEIHDRVSGKRIAWELVTHWRETQDDFLIYIEPQLFHVIPKRVLPSPEVQTALRRLFEDRIAPGGEGRLSAAQRGSMVPFLTLVAIFAVILASAIEAAAAMLT